MFPILFSDIHLGEMSSTYRILASVGACQGVRVSVALPLDPCNPCKGDAERGEDDEGIIAWSFSPGLSDSCRQR